MKKLSITNVSVSGGNVTITGTISEAEKNEFRFPARQSTELYINQKNPRWPRHIQISNLSVFVKAFGNGMAISHDDLVKIANAVEPKTSFPPTFRQGSDGLQVELCSELKPDLQWQVSDSLGSNANWTNIPGQTSGVLSKDAAKVGQFVRLIASSEAGSMTSTPAQIK